MVLLAGVTTAGTTATTATITTTGAPPSTTTSTTTNTVSGGRKMGMGYHYRHQWGHCAHKNTHNAIGLVSLSVSALQ